MNGYAVTLLDTNHVEWALTDGAPGRSGVWLMGPPDLQSEINSATRATTKQIGAEPTGWSIDPMTGTLQFGLWSTEGLLEPWSAFVNGLSPFRDSVLTVVTPGHGEAVARVRLDGQVPMPDQSPASRGLLTLAFDVPVVAYAGAWEADVTVSSQSSTSWINLGDLPARGLIRWSGPGATVRIREVGGAFDTGVVALPTPPAGVTAELDLDPAVASRVTVDGEPNPVLWRAMRARFFPDILPGHDVVVTLTGVAEVELAARITHPWRWTV